jgi:eukaryotic-like serine/threonine-protein kinase
MSSDTPFSDTRADTDGPTRSSAKQIELPPVTYQLSEVIGRGGMGEVVLARDTRFGREVALKRIGGEPDDQTVQRFLREARVQARLDHPAVVPVYELGVDVAGRPFFTMKRLTGVTLAKRLEEHGPLQPALRALVDVCQAIDFAHERGIVHRDLKPSNIMLGNHGEVYVLDWGVARVLDEERAPTQPKLPADPGDTPDGTKTGALLGTPGYISPEVINGRRATRPSDVYALGSILFEILAGEPLHPRGTAALVATMAQPQASPAQRRPERPIPPELDRLCIAALAEDPKSRPTARALAERIQAYLDGDRDVEQRRQLAASVLEHARTALAAGDRSTAIQRAGRALALDPESADAAELVTSLIVEPPRELPAELAASLDADDRVASAQRTRRSVTAYLAILAFWPVTPFLEITATGWRWIIALNTCIAVLLVFGLRATRRQRLSVPLAMLGNLALAALMTRIASPFLLTPLVICGAMLVFSADRWTMTRPYWLAVWGVAAVTLPLALEWLHLFPTSWRVDASGFHAWSTFYPRPNTVAAVALALANLVFVIVIGCYAVAINQSADAAKRQLHVQAWHLRKLLPSRARLRTHH